MNLKKLNKRRRIKARKQKSLQKLGVVPTDKTTEETRKELAMENGTEEKPNSEDKAPPTEEIKQLKEVLSKPTEEIVKESTNDVTTEKNKPVVKEESQTEEVTASVSKEEDMHENIKPVLKVENKAEGSKVKEEDDDVPGDFFDDFLKDDFMAGLDIVDEESEDASRGPTKPKGKTVIINRKLSTEVKKTVEKIDHVKKFRESPPDKSSKTFVGSKYKPRSEAIKDELRELDAQLEKIRQKKPAIQSRLGGIEPDTFDITHRRDPEKVRRDIQMDKQRCERKLITDIVETGLVPPGMELEVEFNDVRRQVRIDKHKPPGDLREILRSRRSRSHDKKKRSLTPDGPRDRRKRSLTPKERRRSHTPKEKRRSLTPKERKRSPTPEKRKRSGTPDKKKRTVTPEKPKEQKKSDTPEKESRRTSTEGPKRRDSDNKVDKTAKVSPKRTERNSAKSVSRKSSKSPRRTPPKRRRSKSPMASEVESIKSSVDDIIDAHLESRRAKREARSRDRDISRKRSPLKRSPIYRRSPPPRRSPLYRRVSSPSPRRSPRRRSPRRSRSPSYRRRRRDNSRGRDISRSPRRSRRSRSPRPLKREEKKSFLEELAEKLNTPTTLLQHSQPYVRPHMGPFDAQIRTPVILDRPMQPITPMMQPVPRGMINTGPGLLGPLPERPPPVAAPQPPFFPPRAPQVIPQPQPSTYDPYDQSFFIGNDPLPSQSFNSAPAQPPQPPLKSPVAMAGRKSSSVERKPADMAKLFEDEKISLSEFLAITAKPQGSSSSSAKLQEKVKVISQCQEAAKILKSNRRFAGPLIIEPSDEKPEPSKQKYLSPLLMNPVIQLPYTTPGAKKVSSTPGSEYVKYCQSLLYKVGISKTLPAVRSNFEDPKKPREVSPDVMFLPPVKSKPQIHQVIQFSQIPSKAPTKNIFIQTDPQLAACKECERRRELGTEDTGTQVGDSKMTFSVSTQVNESDFYSTIPKSQSLANLTPAQLMGKQLRNLDGRGSVQPTPTYSHSRSTPLYDEYAPPARGAYSQRGGFHPNEDIFPPNPGRFNRSPSPNSHFRDSGVSRSLSETLRASLGSRFPPRGKY